jgi:hypothetical protein
MPPKAKVLKIVANLAIAKSSLFILKAEKVFSFLFSKLQKYYGLKAASTYQTTKYSCRLSANAAYCKLIIDKI